MKSPAFQFYPADYLASQRVSMMTLEEQGAYMRLICYCWLHGSIPSDPDKIARLIAFNGCSTDVVATVQRMFSEHPTDKTKLVHDRLDDERQKQEKRSKQCSEAGKSSADARKNATDAQRTLNVRSANAQREVNPSSSSSSSKERDITVDSKSNDKTPDSGSLPSVDEVIAFGARSMIHDDYCREFHAKRTEQRMWLNGRGELTDWRKTLNRFWNADRHQWGPNGKLAGQTSKPRVNVNSPGHKVW